MVKKQDRVSFAENVRVWKGKAGRYVSRGMGIRRAVWMQVEQSIWWGSQEAHFKTSRGWLVLFRAIGFSWCERQHHHAPSSFVRDFVFDGMSWECTE